MSRCMQHAEGQAADLKLFAVLRAVAVKTAVRIRAIDDLSAGLLGELEVAGHEVCMKVRLKHILDLSIVFLRAPDVGCSLPQRVNDGGFAAALDVVGSLSKASGIYLFDLHSDVLYDNDAKVMNKIVSFTDCHQLAKYYSHG